jgi:hypothetical protein
MEVMHWEREDVRVEAADPDTSGFAVASISNPALASEAETPTVTTVLEMERWRGRPDGIFVITKATSDAISIERPLQYEDFGPAPVFEGNLAMVPDGVLAIGAWKHDLSRIYAFAPPKEHFKFDLADRRRPESGPVHEDWPWGSHSIASVRLIHAPGFLPLSNGEAEEPWGPDGPVLAMSAYRLGQYLPDPESPTGGETPVPGPTPTGDDETPAPVKIVIEDRTGANKTLNYAYAWIEARGRGTDHGGYDVGEAYNSGFEGSQETSVAPTLTGDPIPITTIYCEPQYDAEAARMQRLLFPGARISREPPDDGVNVDYGDHQPALRVELGQDFAERHRQAMDAYWFLGDFGLAREVESPRAYSFVTEEAARAYREGPELSMYEYAAGRPFDVGVTQNGGVPVDGEPGVELSLTYYGDTEADFHSELVRVSIVDGELRVVEASLVASGSS